VRGAPGKKTQDQDETEWSSTADDILPEKEGSAAHKTHVAKQPVQ